MNDSRNEDRAGWAGNALLDYAVAKKDKAGFYDGPATVLTDMLCDLMHYAGLKQIDLEECIRTARMHYQAELAEELGNQFGLRCPDCGKGDQIDIAATVWVRLCPDGTDVMQGANGDHEWSNHSGAACAACGHAGTVSDFSRSGEPEHRAGVAVSSAVTAGRTITRGPLGEARRVSSAPAQEPAGAEKLPTPWLPEAAGKRVIGCPPSPRAGG
jgi:hypothetical protein